MSPSDDASAHSHPSRVTVRDIAKATGFHYTTVSMALRNSVRLRPETRQKIQKAATLLGYSPDPMLSALNAYRRTAKAPHFQAVIGWINNWPEREALMSTFGAYYEGACDRARQLGYLLEEFWLCGPGMSPEKLRRMLKARNIQALLMAPQPLPHMNPGIDFEGYSAVAFGYSMDPPVLHLVTNHHFSSMSLLLSSLFDLGYRRIGLYVGNEWDDKTGNACLGAALVFKRKHPEVVLILREDETNADLGKWLTENKPEAVVSYDSVAQGIADLGYAIPEEIGFASLDRNPQNQHLAGIDQNTFLTGQKAVDVLVGMIHRGERGLPEVPIRTLVESKWVPGKTLRQQKSKSVKARPTRQRTRGL